MVQSTPNRVSCIQGSREACASCEAWAQEAPSGQNKIRNENHSKEDLMSELVQALRRKFDANRGQREKSMLACEAIVNEFKGTWNVSIDYITRTFTVSIAFMDTSRLWLFSLEVGHDGKVRVSGNGVEKLTVADISKFDILTFVYRCCLATGVRP